MEKRLQVRPIFVFIHRWVGLFLAGFLIIEGVTGSLLAFRGDLTRLLDPGATATPPYQGARPLNPGELARRTDVQLFPEAQVAYFFPTPDGGQQIVRIRPRIDPSTGKPYRIDFGIVIVDPWTGHALQRLPFERYSNNPIHNIMPFVYQLHTNLALDGFGTWVLGWVALIWTLDCIYSVYLTLPTRLVDIFPKWGKSWEIKWPTTSIFRFNFDLHRASGLWTWILLLAFAWSSVNLTLLPVYEAVTGTLMDYTPIMKTISDLPQHDASVRPRLGWVAAEIRGRDILNDIGHKEGFHVEKMTTMAYFPENGIYSIEFRTSRRLPQFQNLGVYFDGDTGRVNRVLYPSGQHVGDTLTNWLRSIHMITDPLDNLVYRWVVFAFGFLLSALSGTGIYIWWVKRKGQRRRLAGIGETVR